MKNGQELRGDGGGELVYYNRIS